MMKPKATKLSASSKPDENRGPLIMETTESSAKQVGTITLILEQLLINVDFLTLKTCRLVNKTWNKLSSCRMLQDDLSRLKLTEYTDGKGLYRTLKNSTKFPCSDLHISVSANLNNYYIQQILWFWGPSVKSLILTRVDVSDKKILDLFLRQVKNIEKLTLDGGMRCIRWKSQPDSRSEQILLPSLKTLVFSQSRRLEVRCRQLSIAYDILMGSPNLERIENLIISKVDAQFWLDKIHLIKSYIFVDYMHNYKQNPNHLEIFSQAQPKLESFQVHDFARKQNSTELLIKILKSSKQTLLYFEADSFFFLPQIQFPQLINLKVLTLRIDRHHNFDANCFTQFALKDQTLMSTMPNLETIRLRLTLMEDELWQQYEALPSNFDNNFKSVRNLEICASVAEEDFMMSFWTINLSCGWMERLKQLFPNVVNMNIKHCLNPDVTTPKIFETWSRLKSLRLNLNIFEPDVDNDEEIQPGFMDPAFTGLSPGKCWKFVRSNKQFQENHVQKLRGQVSLFTMKELTKLEIVIEGRGYEALGPWTELPISKVSCLYAFNLLPTLRVTVAYDHSHSSSHWLKSRMEPLEPSITLIHHKYF